jgi:hypothetical protein
MLIVVVDMRRSSMAGFAGGAMYGCPKFGCPMFGCSTTSWC